MAAQVLFCFTAFLVIFLSMEGAFARSSNVKNATDIDSGKVIVKGNYNAVNLYPEKHVQKQLESFEERLVALEKPGMSASSNSIRRSYLRTDLFVKLSFRLDFIGVGVKQFYLTSLVIEHVVGYTVQSSVKLKLLLHQQQLPTPVNRKHFV